MQSPLFRKNKLDSQMSLNHCLHHSEEKGGLNARSGFRGKMTLLSRVRAYRKCRSTIFSLMAIYLIFKTPTWFRHKLSNVEGNIISIYLRWELREIECH